MTFRQDDSLPQEKLRELRAFRREWDRRNPIPRNEQQLRQLAFETMRRVEAWLDQGSGSCRLRESTSAEWVAKAMHHFDGNRYELGCYVVMRNHVHAIVRPFDFGADTLQRVLKSWKGYTASRINEKFAQTGAFWQEESFDRIIRDAEHLYRAIQYIGANPAKAGLNPGVARLWIRPEWKALGWGFEEA